MFTSEKGINQRSSRPDVFCEKGVLRNFATLLKKRLWHRCFPVNFAKFLRTPFFTEHLWWLLLKSNYSSNNDCVERNFQTILNEFLLMLITT